MPEEVQTEQPEHPSELFTEPISEVIEAKPEPVITEQNGRVVNVFIPQELIDNPPTGTDRRQLEFIQAASDAGVLTRIRLPQVKRIVRYYCTEARLETMGAEEGVDYSAIGESIRRGVIKIYRLLWNVWYMKYNSPLPFNEKFPFEVIRRSKRRRIISGVSSDDLEN
jgi:hypothetical protein